MLPHSAKCFSIASAVTPSGSPRTRTSALSSVPSNGSATWIAFVVPRSLLRLRLFMALTAASLVWKSTLAVGPPWMAAKVISPACLKWSFSSCQATPGLMPCTRTLFMKSVEQSNSTRRTLLNSTLPSSVTLAFQASSAFLKRTSPYKVSSNRTTLLGFPTSAKWSRSSSSLIPRGTPCTLTKVFRHPRVLYTTLRVLPPNTEPSSSSGARRASCSSAKLTW
mmetsp:Transcript_71047/g.211811  ORF Transcript_71047/g.211811 Transcript_71047/m.211811 type:complete len:222 (+) Transcript_71047:189-854(+)